MVKLLNTEIAKRGVDICLQFFGGYGYMEEYPIARMYRDVRVGTIVGGTSEIMKEILSKIIIDDVSYNSSYGTKEEHKPKPLEWVALALISCFSLFMSAMGIKGLIQDLIL